jgi:prolipoprotein diacylglyceryltransferase
MWLMRNRTRRDGDLAWLVLGLFAVGRFFEFFARSDSPGLALGLDNAQWTSIAMLVAVVAGWRVTKNRRLDPAQDEPGSRSRSPRA